MAYWSNVNKAQQGWDMDLAEEVEEFTINIKIHHDTSHPFQSSATCSYWNNGWVPVASLMYQEWAFNTQEESFGPVGMWEAADELRARAASLLLHGAFDRV